MLNTVLFCPEDLYLIREGRWGRRRFLDSCICQLRPRYAAALAEYRKLYDQKTRICGGLGGSHPCWTRWMTSIFVWPRRGLYDPLPGPFCPKLGEYAPHPPGVFRRAGSWPCAMRR